ncbi:MAG: 3TM-type holin [Rhabdaerophilum sp.]
MIAASILAPIAIKAGATIIGKVLRSKNQNTAAEVVDMLAGVFGSAATPEAVADAIEADPAASDKLARLERDRLPELQALLDHELATYRLQHDQMAREAISERWWQSAWRPFFGACYALAFLALGAAIAKAIWTGNRAVMDALAVTPAALLGMDGKQSFGVFILLVMMIGAAVMGVYVWKRSEEKKGA